MEHSSHDHALVLNENYVARESGDVCRGCGEQIFSSKSFVYSCSLITSTDNGVDGSCANFLLHKNCAELPASIHNPTDPEELLQLCFDYHNHKQFRVQKMFGVLIDCSICDIRIPWSPNQFFYYNDDFTSYICLSCAMFQTQTSLEDPKSMHPSHDQHLLFLIQHASSFKCYACNVDDNIRDMSYKCTQCRFWIHKSCADAPMSFRFQFHKHPLVLSFSLPPIYHKFGQFCGLCNKKLSRLVWIYYCRICRLFAHFQCARSNRFMIISSQNEKYDSNVVQLPAADELSVKLLREKFIKATSIQNNNSIHNIYISENGIKHWTHEKHLLQLINSNELKIEQDYDEILLLCNGCTQPIEADQFYGCVACKYFLHKFCAELPEQIKNPFSSGYVNASKHNEPYKLFHCYGCEALCNGIFFDCGAFGFLHIGCITLPKMVKHETHHHMLKHVVNAFAFYQSFITKRCKACGKLIQLTGRHECKQCDYNICDSCIMKPKVANHPWDHHPLRLIYEAGMVNDHEHDFNCEFCYEDIDTNYWFYHCSDCDLSLHLHKCFEKSSHLCYSNVKFGATDIIIDKLHPHSLTLVLNKKFRSCENCRINQLGEPVLECVAPCKSIFCRSCIEVVTKKQDVRHDSNA